MSKIIGKKTLYTSLNLALNDHGHTHDSIFPESLAPANEEPLFHVSAEEHSFLTGEEITDLNPMLEYIRSEIDVLYGGSWIEPGSISGSSLYVSILKRDNFQEGAINDSKVDCSLRKRNDFVFSRPLEEVEVIRKRCVADIQAKQTWTSNYGPLVFDGNYLWSVSKESLSSTKIIKINPLNGEKEDEITVAKAVSSPYEYTCGCFDGIDVYFFTNELGNDNQFVKINASTFLASEGSWDRVTEGLGSYYGVEDCVFTGKYILLILNEINSTPSGLYPSCIYVYDSFSGEVVVKEELSVSTESGNFIRYKHCFSVKDKIFFAPSRAYGSVDIENYPIICLDEELEIENIHHNISLIGEQHYFKRPVFDGSRIWFFLKVEATEQRGVFLDFDLNKLYSFFLDGIHQSIENCFWDGTQIWVSSNNSLFSLKSCGIQYTNPTWSPDGIIEYDEDFVNVYEPQEEISFTSLDYDGWLYDGSFLWLTSDTQLNNQRIAIGKEQLFLSEDGFIADESIQNHHIAEGTLSAVALENSSFTPAIFGGIRCPINKLQTGQLSLNKFAYHPPFSLGNGVLKSEHFSLQAFNDNKFFAVNCFSEHNFYNSLFKGDHFIDRTITSEELSAGSISGGAFSFAVKIGDQAPLVIEATGVIADPTEPFCSFFVIRKTIDLSFFLFQGENAEWEIQVRVKRSGSEEAIDPKTIDYSSVQNNVQLDFMEGTLYPGDIISIYYTVGPGPTSFRVGIDEGEKKLFPLHGNQVGEYNGYNFSNWGFA